MVGYHPRRPSASHPDGGSAHTISGSSAHVLAENHEQNRVASAGIFCGSPFSLRTTAAAWASTIVRGPKPLARQRARARRCPWRAAPRGRPAAGPESLNSIALKRSADENGFDAADGSRGSLREAAGQRCGDSVLIVAEPRQRLVQPVGRGGTPGYARQSRRQDPRPPPWWSGTRRSKITPPLRSVCRS